MVNHVGTRLMTVALDREEWKLGGWKLVREACVQRRMIMAD